MSIIILNKECKFCGHGISLQYIYRKCASNTDVVILKKIKDDKYECRLVEKCYNCGYKSEFIEEVTLCAE